MDNDQLNRLCAQAMTLVSTGKWEPLRCADGIFSVTSYSDDEALVFLLDENTPVNRNGVIAGYVAAVQPSVIIAMVRRIRELEEKLAKAKYARAKSWAIEVVEWPHSDEEVAEARTAAESAKVAWDNAAAAFTAVGGRL